MDPLDSPFADITEAPIRERGIAKVRYTHESMIDLIIERGGIISQGEIAAYFGYSQAWISTIMCSDAFQARLAERREQLIDPVLRMSLDERFRALITRSTEVLMEKLAQPAHAVDSTVALRVAEMGARVMAAGISARAPRQDPDVLERLADRLVALKKRADAGETFDVDAKEVGV